MPPRRDGLIVTFRVFPIDFLTWPHRGPSNGILHRNEPTIGPRWGSSQPHPRSGCDGVARRAGSARNEGRESLQ